MAKAASELRLRVVSALILAAMALSSVWAGGTWFALFVSIIAFLVFLEWTAIIGLNGFESKRYLTAIVMLLALLALLVFGVSVSVGVVLLCSAAVYYIALATTRETAIWAALAVCYCGLAAVSLVSIRNGGQGLSAILLLFAIVWGTDIGAYFVGRKLGGPKLAPKISPGKTQSGAIGGIVVSMAAAAIVSMITGFLNPVFAVFVAIFVSAVSQAGDLFESYLKRHFGVKDSGYILPGHGGLFDRVDGLMPAAIVLFVFSFVM